MTLTWKKGEWLVSGNCCSQFVSVNNKKGKKGICVVGDVIVFLSLKIVLGSGFFAINDLEKKVVVNSEKIREQQDYFVDPYGKDDGEMEEKIFNRFPRKREALVINPIIMEAPPISLSLENMPLLLRMGSPLIMSSASLLAGNITAMLSSVLFPVLTQKYTDNVIIKQTINEKIGSKYNGRGKYWRRHKERFYK